MQRRPTVQYAATIAGVTLGLMTGCQRSGVQGQEVRFEPEPAWSLVSRELDLGEHRVGTTAFGTVEIRNDGNVPLGVSELGLRDGFEDVKVRAMDLDVLPGETGRVELEWTVSRPTLLEDRLRVWMTHDGEALGPEVVDLRGSAIGPDLALSVVEHDFGEVSLGCSQRLAITLSNPGNGELDISTIALLGGTEFRLGGDTGLRSLPPFGRAELEVVYSPRDERPDAAALRVETELGTVTTQVRGTGIAETYEEASFATGGTEPVAILVFVNEFVAWSFSTTFKSVFEDALPTLFQDLQDSGTPYRIAFIGDSSGAIVGPGYIDDSQSVSSAVRDAIAQTAVAATVGDNDRMSATLLNALDENERWIFDSDWLSSYRVEEPHVVLIGINDDADQSGLPAADIAADMRTFMRDPSRLSVHGISGLSTGGGGGGGSCFAVPNAPFQDLVAITGGTYHDVCAPSWAPAFRTITREVAPPSSSRGGLLMPMRGTPLISSIEVRVGEERLRGDWHYDEAQNAVIIDNRIAPAADSVLLSYRTSLVCGG